MSERHINKDAATGREHFTEDELQKIAAWRALVD